MSMRPPDQATTERTQPGSIAVGRPGDAHLAELTDDRPIRHLPVPDKPWHLAGDLLVVEVVDDVSHMGALDAAQRGADVIVALAPERRAAFVEDVERLGLTNWQPRSVSSDVDWAPILEALAAGATTEEAARRSNLSLRSAHRRLAQARAALGVTSTAAAVAIWVATGRDRSE
jgi:hypothetical protein